MSDSGSSSGAKLFVGGLSWDTTNESLKQAFESYGEIEDAVIIMDRNTGRSRGFGFVTFISSSSADSALALNATQLDGREIRVQHASESGSGGRGGGGSRSYDGGGSSGGAYRRGGFGGSRGGGGGSRGGPRSGPYDRRGSGGGGAGGGSRRGGGGGSSGGSSRSSGGGRY